jgi:hypothetical protein
MIKNILNEQFKDLISEETLQTIEAAFQEAVTQQASDKVQAETAAIKQQLEESFEESLEAKSKERVELETQNLREKLDEQYTAKLEQVLEKIDADHSAKLKKIVEAIDTDHAVKLQRVVKQIDKKHTAMLQQVVEKYEHELREEATSFQSRLVEEVSNYFDLYIDKNLPQQQISEAVQNIRAAKQLAQIRQIVGISEEFIDSEVKEALVDGKRTIDSLRAELNESLKTNAELNQRANRAEAAILLEQKTADMPSAKRQFVTKLLKNKAPQYIEENISYVVAMFEKESQEEVDEIKESVKQQFTQAPRVDRPQVLEEQQSFNNEIARADSSDSVTGYLNEMKSLSKFAR